MTTQEMIAGLRDADRSMTPGRWEDYHTDDNSFMSMSTVGIGAEPADENDLGRTVLVTLLQMPGTVGRENGRWEEDAIFCAWLRNNAATIADELERLANEVSHLKGMLLAATNEVERLRKENEALTSANETLHMVCALKESDRG